MRVNTEVTLSGFVERKEAEALGLRLPLSMLVEEWANAPAAARIEGLPDADLRGRR